MPRVDLELSVDIERTARVAQVEGIFDVPAAKRRTVDFHFDVPLEEHDWRIGLIVGPSGGGKSSVARHLFGDSIVSGYEWEPRRSVVDSFPEGMPIREVTAALSSVGFSSPPAWVKPFSVLSNGEQFRANLARTLVDERPLIVVDEFTSVVDRTVARVGSHAVAKAVRRHPAKRFVAVSCHDDIIEWLQPDWILEPHVGGFHWRSVQPRPALDFELVRVRRSAWSWFAPHHYLSGSLPGGRYFAGLVDGRPACFLGVRHFMHARVDDLVVGSRAVTHPDFQGLGLITHVMSPLIGAIAKANGKRYRALPAHPALVHGLARSPVFRMVSAPKLQEAVSNTGEQVLDGRRRVASFEYIGPEYEDKKLARRMWQ